MNKFKLALVSAAAAALLVPAAAQAQLSFNIGAVSLYKSSGADQEGVDKNWRPALQGGVDYAFGNGFSGPSNSTGSKIAKINNNPTPVGGPTTCSWKTNNCGPNDEPFSFHTGGVTGVMGDGSVRFIRDSIDPVVLKYAIGASDGQITDLDK